MTSNHPSTLISRNLTHLRCVGSTSSCIHTQQSISTIGIYSWFTHHNLTRLKCYQLCIRTSACDLLSTISFNFTTTFHKLVILISNISNLTTTCHGSCRNRYFCSRIFWFFSLLWRRFNSWYLWSFYIWNVWKFEIRNTRYLTYSTVYSKLKFIDRTIY